MARLKAVKMRKKLLYEIGVGITLLIVLLGVLSSVTMNARSVLIDNDYLMSHAKIAFFYRNTTDNSRTALVYNASDVATLYNGWLYISVPAAPAGYDALDDIAFIIYKDDNYTTKWTYKDLIEYGVGRIEIEMEIVNNTAITLNPSSIFLEFWPGPIVLEDSAPIISNGSIKWSKTYDIDTGWLVAKITSLGLSSSGINDWELRVAGVPPSTIDAIKIKFTVYGVSKKPVLAIYAQPLYAAFTAIVSALYAAVRRIQQYALSAFGGLGLATLFSGLTGSAVAAMVLAIIFFVVMVELRKKR